MLVICLSVFCFYLIYPKLQEACMTQSKIVSSLSKHGREFLSTLIFCLNILIGIHMLCCGNAVFGRSLSWGKFTVLLILSSVDVPSCWREFEKGQAASESWSILLCICLWTCQISVVSVLKGHGRTFCYNNMQKIIVWVVSELKRRICVLKTFSWNLMAEDCSCHRVLLMGRADKR